MLVIHVPLSTALTLLLVWCLINSLKVRVGQAANAFFQLAHGKHEHTQSCQK